MERVIVGDETARRKNFFLPKCFSGVFIPRANIREKRGIINFLSSEDIKKPFSLIHLPDFSLTSL
jgi:hypothetical protein